MINGIFGHIMFFTIREILRWRENWVQSDTKSILKHVGYNPIQDWATCLQAGICVDFNQVSFEFVVDHKIKTKYLEIVLKFCWIEKDTSCFDRVSCNFLHHWIHVLHEIVLTIVHL